ncbi:MAG: hypothetical protein JWP63_7230 [Candidatus Solibacter sp.]|nr:hypothetical protein [Candidatus Solibacter sp.]
MWRRSIFAVGCLAWGLSLTAAEPGVRVQVAGGTVPELAPKSRIQMDLTGTATLFFHSGKSDLRIAYRKINTVEYGQNVSRRYAAAVLISPVLLLSKSRRHFVTIGYVDEENKQQALVIRVEKGDIRSVLAGLEARTGRRIEYQDGEARKAGKG